jgi:hypothetical protein
MPNNIKSLSEPSFIRVGELMGKDISSAMATEADSVADMVAEGIRRKRKTPINEAKKLIKSIYADKELDEANRKRLVRVLRKGADEVSDSSLLKRQAARINRIVDNISGTVAKSSEMYLERIMLPKIAKMQANGSSAADIRASVKKWMEDSQHYWDNVANTAASRSFHYGSMLAAQGSGLSKMTYHAVIDDVTTDFCRAIDGKTVNLSVAITKAENVLMQPPSDMLSDGFWKAAQELVDNNSVTAANIMKSGLTLPPFHGHCRTTSMFH